MISKDVELLRGAIELHAHGYPEYSVQIPKSQTNLEWFRSAISAGMRGIVVKSHVLPTVGEAKILNEIFPDFRIFGSLTLNLTCGGLNPLLVELAGELGVKIIWMPTWSSRHALKTSLRFFNRLKRNLSILETISTGQGITIFEENGELLPEVNSIIDIVKQYDMVLASGHLSSNESFALAKAAREKGVKFIFTHPSSKTIGASLEQEKQVADMGGYIEFALVTAMPMVQSLNPSDIAGHIREIGSERCIITTDSIFPWDPYPVEAMRMFIAILLEIGMTEESIQNMTQRNPAKLLGIE